MWHEVLLSGSSSCCKRFRNSTPERESIPDLHKNNKSHNPYTSYMM